jgi:hypothetical protein
VVMYDSGLITCSYKFSVVSPDLHDDLDDSHRAPRISDDAYLVPCVFVSSISIVMGFKILICLHAMLTKNFHCNDFSIRAPVCCAHVE